MKQLITILFIYCLQSATAQPLITVEPVPGNVTGGIYSKHLCNPTNDCVASDSVAYTGLYSWRFDLRTSYVLCAGNKRAELYLSKLNLLMAQARWWDWYEYIPTWYTSNNSPEGHYQIHSDSTGGSPMNELWYQNNIAYWAVSKDSLNTGSQSSRLYALAPLTKGQWVRWTVHYVYSTGPSGLLEIWRNGVKVLTITGANGIPSLGNRQYYFSFGAYKWQWGDLPGPFAINQIAFYIDNMKVYGANTTINDIIAPTPNPPVATASANQVITLPTSSVTLTGTVTPGAAAITSYLWTKQSGPGSGTITTPTAISTTVTGMVAGSYVFSFVVTDSLNSKDTAYTTVTVNPAPPPPNQPPVANAGTNTFLTLPINSTVLNGTATDTDGTIVSTLWSKISGPATYTIANAADDTTALTNLVAGIYKFQFKATDNNGASDSAEVTVTVYAAAPPNMPPVANAGSNVSIVLPTNSTTLRATATDVDGTVVTRAWSLVSGPVTYTFANAAADTTLFSNLVAGTYNLRFVITDNLGAIDTAWVSVIVIPANLPPVVNAGTADTITLPTSSTALNGSATDTDGTIVSYLWTKISGPSTYTITDATDPTTTATGLVQGTYEFSLRATDNRGATGSATVRITVNPVSTTPARNHRIKIKLH